MPQEEDRIRTIAGYLLKNNCKSIARCSPEAAAFVKASVLQAFGESSHLVRNAASQDVVALLGFLEPRNWPECLQYLVQMLDAQNDTIAEVRIHHFSTVTYSPCFRPRSARLRKAARITRACLTQKLVERDHLIS